jgi:NAD(P)H-dependent FMN reductase
MDVNSIKNSKELETQLSEKSITTWKEFLFPFRNHGHIRILAVGSGLREGSYSTFAAKMALDLSNKNYGAVTNFLDLRHTKLPTYDPDDSSQKNIQVGHLVKWTDAFMPATPDYHGSMSGAMKNFLDHFWEEFAGKTFGYICASHEKGLTVMDQMRTAVRQCYGWSLPYGISIDGEQDFNNKEEIINMLLNKRLRMLARDLVVYGSLIRGQFLQDIIDDDLSDTFAARYRSLLLEQKALVRE